MGNIHTVGPNEALIISGGCCRPTKKTTIVGGWAWTMCVLTDVQRISLQVMTLNPRCENVETSQGVPITVTAVAQCKVMKEKEFLAIAAEQFLGKDVEHIKSVVLQTLEGHLRAILGTLTVEEVYRDREQFASLVREVASPDVGRMGIEILSFTVKDVYDHVDYLLSLGKAQIAAVQRDANIGVALAERDAEILESECEKSSLSAKYSANAKVEDSSKAFKLEEAGFHKEVSAKKAEAKLAYELQKAKLQQEITREEMQIKIVERKKQIVLETEEVIRKEKELISTVRLPADAEAFRITTIASGMKTSALDQAKCESEKITMIGEAEAFVTDAMGKAEAESLRTKAAAYKQYTEAAILQMTLDTIPKVAAEIAAPLSKTDEIVLLSGAQGSTGVGEISKLVSQVPPVISALTGYALKDVVSRMGKTS